MAINHGIMLFGSSSGIVGVMDRYFCLIVVHYINGNRKVVHRMMRIIFLSAISVVS